jgi:hypothetical protein
VESNSIKCSVPSLQNQKGWTSNLHGVEWLKRVFKPTTRAKANEEQQRLLICDGHDSRISESFISHCMQNCISIPILPPHTSHVLQPLDVAIFEPFQKRLTTALSRFNEAKLTRIIYHFCLERSRVTAISTTRNIPYLMYHNGI